MSYLTTNFKEFVRERIQAQIKEKKEVMIIDNANKPVAPKKTFYSELQEEFDKIMRDYDNL